LNFDAIGSHAHADDPPWMHEHAIVERLHGKTKVDQRAYDSAGVRRIHCDPNIQIRRRPWVSAESDCVTSHQKILNVLAVQAQ
jgi:hypothetical protein